MKTVAILIILKLININKINTFYFNLNLNLKLSYMKMFEIIVYAFYSFYLFLNKLLFFNLRNSRSGAIH